MYQVRAIKENENNIVVFDKSHFVDEENLCEVVWSYLKNCNPETINWSKSMLSIQGKVFSGMEDKFKTTIKIVRLITILPPEDLIVPEWFLALFGKGEQ